MGKARIISGSDGSYSVTQKFDVARATVEIIKLEKDIVESEAQRAKIVVLRDEQETLVIGLHAAANQAIYEYSECLKQVPQCSQASSLLAAVNTALDKLYTAKLLLFGYTETAERLLAERQAARKRIAWLETKAPATTGPVQMTSCDNIDDAPPTSSDVGTIDLMAATGFQAADLKLPTVHTILRPLYTTPAFSKARDYAETPIAAMSPAQAAHAAATWPYGVKYNPRWVSGRIIATNTAANTADVELWGSTPEGDIPPNFDPPITLSNVPVQYMQCHAAAFRIGDWVVVEFANSKRTSPKVIGFVTNPRKCPKFNGWKIHNGKYVHSSYDPGDGWTWTATSVQAGNLSWTGGVGSNTKTVSWWGRDGRHVGPNDNRTTYVYCEGVALYFPFPVFGAFAKREDQGGGNYVWFVYAFCRNNSFSTDREYLYKRRADGTGGTTTVWDAPSPTFAEGASYSSANWNAVFVNASGTRAVGGYIPALGTAQYSKYPDSTSWTYYYAFWNLSNLSAVTRTLEKRGDTWALPKMTSAEAVQVGTWAGQPIWYTPWREWSLNKCLGIEWEGDTAIEIWYRYRARLDSAFAGVEEGTVLGGHTMSFTWDITAGDVTLYERNQAGYYNGSADTASSDYTENLYILGVTKTTVTLNMRSASRVHGASSAPYPAENEKWVWCFGQRLSYQENSTPASTWPSGSNPWVCCDSTIYPANFVPYNMGQSEYWAYRYHVGYGPDEKYLAVTWGWNWTAEYFADDTTHLFFSNDVNQAAFETASGASEPYQGSVGVI